MRIRYTWTQQEWTAAVRLAERRAVRTSIPPLTYALILVPLLGGLGQTVVQAIQSHTFKMAGTVLPALLATTLSAAALLILAGVLQRRSARRKNRVATMPQGEYEAVLREAGWRVTQINPGPPRSPLDETLPDDQAPTPQPLQAWTDFYATRQDEWAFVLLRTGGFLAMPTRVLTPDQGGHLHRMIARKLRPTA